MKKTLAALLAAAFLMTVPALAAPSPKPSHRPGHSNSSSSHSMKSNSMHSMKSTHPTPKPTKKP
ncbi:MAG TPA: hypothetical protein VMF11_02990 [Candidatus Baltobacteraceae bacterium]|nr:hypothetical protein [Candidatus Baltobacteraceae bacterium]